MNQGAVEDDDGTRWHQHDHFRFPGFAIFGIDGYRYDFRRAIGFGEVIEGPDGAHAKTERGLTTGRPRAVVAMKRLGVSPG